MGLVMAQNKEILVIMGSVRAGRRCPLIATWVAELGRQQSEHHYQVIDLNDWPLPMDDEPAMPASGQYQQPHTQAWSKKISEAAAIVFVTPEYNGGYPSALKNAIDHLYAEWNDKPTLLVSYGGRGGTRSAGQLLQVLNGLKMHVVPTSPAIVIPAVVSREGAELEPEKHFQEFLPIAQQALQELTATLG